MRNMHASKVKPRSFGTDFARANKRVVRILIIDAKPAWSRHAVMVRWYHRQVAGHNARCRPHP